MESEQCPVRAFGHLSCKPGGHVIHSFYEDHHRTITRTAGGRDRSGVARPEDFEVRRGTRTATARTSSGTSAHGLLRCHR
jgi:hypothetical protein